MRRRLAAVLDAAALAMAASAVLLFVLGPWRGVVGSGPLTVRWTHALFAALAIAAVRHAAIPAPPIQVRVRRWLDAVASRPAFADALLAFVLTRPAVLAVGFAAVVTFGVLPSSEQPANPRHALRDLPVRFDANWYAGIALEGYYWESSFERQQNIAFFPAYPMIVRAAGHLTDAYDERLPRDGKIVRLAWAGLLVSLTAFLFAAWYFVRLAQELLPPDRAHAGVFLLAAYPFAVFFSAPYTESLFLLAALGTWYHTRHHQYLRGGVWGLLLGLTRPNGFFLAVPLGLIALGARDGAADDGAGRSRVPGLPSRMSWRGLAVAAMPVAGMLLHTAWLYSVSGVPFAWARVQVAWGRVVGAVEPDGFLAPLSGGGLVQLFMEHPYQSLNAIGLVFALALVVPVWRHLGPAWSVYVLLNVLPPLAAGGLLSMGRLTATLFPLFLALAAVLPPRGAPAVAASFAVLQGLVAALFFTWRDMY